MADTPAIPRYPLEWPLGWRRARSRRNGSFRHDRHPINVEYATRRLDNELDRLGAKNAVMSTNVSLNLRGIPRGDERPSDPGVAVYFMFKGNATVLACDSFYTVADNIAGIAGHVEALRRIERYGVGTIEQALGGYKALPADTAADWRAVFGFPKGSRPTLDQLDTVFKSLAKLKHPDIAGGSEMEMAHLNRARDYALTELHS